MRHSSESAAAGDEATAEVRANNRVMRYRRSGAGTALLLLSAWDDLWPEFPALLAQHFRLVIPDLPDDDAEVAAVLHSLLEGLGGVAVPVIAAGRRRAAASQLATSDGDYVSRV